ncbi:MFS transporter [Streptomyces sp. NPDC020800]|uniref:MFS transporter n=1 Tax=Streptomyces sp. NPDC020800 TaxID=3365092 RepID=UPI0037B10778
MTDRTPTTYSAVLATQHVARLLAGTLVGRLPNAMAPIAIVLLVTTATHGTLAFAGALSALYVLNSALSQPVKASLLARYGQTRISGPAACINAGCLLALAATGSGAHPALVTVLVAVAGLCTPPLEAGLRALWPAILAAPDQRRAALALDTGAQGSLFVTGPLIAAYLASTYGPPTALIATAVLGLAGSAVVLTAAPSRTWRAEPPNGTSGTRSPLRNGGLRLLFLGLAGIGFGVGAMNVWAVTMADTHHIDLLTGLIPGSFFAGSFLGGLAYGRRTWPGSTTTQLLAGAAAFTTAWLPILSLPGPYAASALAMLPGLFLPVVIASSYLTADTLTPAGARPSTYAWLILSYGVGTSAGTATAGLLAGQPLAGAALPAIASAAAVVVLAAARSCLRTSAPAIHGQTTSRYGPVPSER